MSDPLIPDPTSYLHWDSWDGSIHEVFDRNARRHPDKICATETSPLRRFSYRDLNEASNVLAHHFVQSGIKRGDVVMIYAYRNVDLVVAIMGTLKAGATFSVLDPAYPPDRQIVYLDVSRPRALVVIRKAAGGRLSPQVQDWIFGNLNLKTSVSALQLQDDAKLTGGATSGQDVLDDAQPLKKSMPDVVVGPDSNPTLSFTSGSEGRPKGVLGRHFSLVYYQSWMADKFGLSSIEKITMLSGISHDPIQRDIFTTLFLGAEVLIPSQEDIQHGLLAEWMNEWKCTMTHLTPAMGQILVGGANNQIPALRNAFFVGDILIKRDVRKLQDIAPNCQAINMFGTTETQRAVSYFLVPSRNEDPEFLGRIGDRIPAGKGMHDVQVLVVDRQNPKRICNIGEQGEIYVRASGLAEGYLGLSDVTKAKFVTSWFVGPELWTKEERKRQQATGASDSWRQFYKGPRDRLYRSGDLGHYNENGDVECTGRADNQVKIRGFRIELGELDTHLSHHPLIRENVTLVRRDKDEEHMLVSYIVPELTSWSKWQQENGHSEHSHDESMKGMLSRFSTLREAVRDYLRTKVPQYAVPSVVVPLNRMPLNPNGKIDKPALPFPNPEELSAALPQRPSVNVSERNSTEETLANIWSSVLQGISSQTIAPEDSFFDLGAHSLTAQRMLLKIRDTWGRIDLPMQSVYDYPTLRGLSAEIDRARDPQGRVLSFESLDPSSAPKQDEQYSADAERLAELIPRSFSSCRLQRSDRIRVFLTGSTGFLGAYILENLLNRKNQSIHVIAHVRAKSSEEAWSRVKMTCAAYGVWSEAWTSSLQVLTGDLEEPHLGISESEWKEMEETVDVIIANGARVHWVSPYSTLRAANVLSTVSMLGLAASGKPKQMAFVSSTSAIGTDHYVKLSEDIVKSGGTGVPEDDDLQGSRKGIDSGYGQTKWAGEFLMREAGRRGLQGCIVRPGYVLGDSRRGITLTDDFLVRMLKGCVQLQSRPDIENTINMVPVDRVARVVVAAALTPPTEPLGVAQVTPHPRLKFNDFLGSLERHGYEVPRVEYQTWSKSLEKYVANGGDHALLPLLHFVTSDLPAQTQGVELDDRHAMTALEADTVSPNEAGVTTDAAVTEELVGKYLGYLVELGFLPAPTGQTARALPIAKIDSTQMQALRQLQGRAAIVP